MADTTFVEMKPLETSLSSPMTAESDSVETISIASSDSSLQQLTPPLLTRSLDDDEQCTRTENCFRCVRHTLLVVLIAIVVVSYVVVLATIGMAGDYAVAPWILLAGLFAMMLWAAVCV